MKQQRIAPYVALVVMVVLAAGCGTGVTPGEGFVTVNGLSAEQLVLCDSGATTLQIRGSGFLSEHGNEILVEFTALQGAPFNGEPSEQVVGIALTDNLIEAPLPTVTGAAELTIKITLPGSNFGISPPETIQVGGTFVGPFARFDNMNTNPSIPMGTGNVTMTVAAPGVLTNDDPSFCTGEGEEGPPEKPWIGDASRSVLLQNLSVVAPPATSNNPFDAAPGVSSPTQEGGTVVIQADGGFVYEPPLGYEGTDVFTYWIQEAGRPDPSDATVILTIEKVVWFIRDTAQNPADAFVGTGRLSDPFDGLGSFNAAQNAPATDPDMFPPTPTIPPNPDDAPQEGDCIFIYDNVVTDAYDGGIRLRDGQQLIGESVGLTLNGTVIVPAATGPDANPVLTNAGLGFGESTNRRPVVTLGNGNVVVGIDIDEPPEGGTYGDGIFGFDVSGPTTIDRVRIRNAIENGIHLGGFPEATPAATALFGGVFTIGVPDDPGPTERVVIDGTGAHGIRIGDDSFPRQTATALTGGATVEVRATHIDNTGIDGIWCRNANLVTANCFWGFAGPIGQDGIDYLNSAFGLCSFTGTNDTMTDIGAFGYFIEAFGGPTAVSITAPFVSESQFSCLWASSTFGGPMTVALDGFHFASATLEGSTVNLIGGPSDSLIVTSLGGGVGFAGQVVPNGNAGGIRCERCSFDADGDVSNGYQTVVGGDLMLGSNFTSPAANQLIQGSGISFTGPRGALTFSQVQIAHSGGSGLFVDVGSFGTTFSFDCAAHAAAGTIISQDGGVAFTCDN